MTRRGWLITLLLLVPLIALIAWWFDTFEHIEREIDAPLHGEARYNPLYALKKVLQARGIDAVSRANLNLQAMDLQPGDTLILGADVRTLSDAQANELVDWVEQGGQLIFALPDGKGRAGALLTAFGLSVVDSLHCQQWSVAEGRDRDWHCFRTAFKPKAGEAKLFDVLWGKPDEGYVFGRRVRERGAWSVAGDLSFLHNAQLKQAGNSELAWQVLGPALHGGKVHLIYAADVLPLHVLLVRYGWPALVPALLALLAWLWSRGQRFGPPLPIAAVHRRALLEHVQAAGDFIFRRGLPTALYAPVHRRFLGRLRRDEPALAALDGEALVAALAQRSGHSVAEVRLALYPVELARPEHFFATIKILNELGSKP